MIDQAVTMVIAGTIENRCVEAMKLISSSTELSEAFVRTLIARKVEAGESLDTILPEVQQVFEHIAEGSESTACIFMAYLWPIASVQIGMHEVSDSIDLWLANYDGSEILDHLRHIASTADYEVVRKHFRQLVAGKS